MSSDPSERKRRWTGSQPWAQSAAGLFVGPALLSISPGVVALFGAATAQGLKPTYLFASPAFAILVVLAFLSIVALNGVFVASETGITQLRPAMVGAYKGEERTQDRLEHLLAHRDRYVAGAFMGSQTMRAWLILLCLFPAYALAEYFGAAKGGVEIGMVVLWAVGLSIPVASINVLFGELIPKTLASAYPVVVSIKLFPFIRFAAGAFALPTRLVISVAQLVTKRIGADPSFSPESKVEEEIKSLIETYGDSGQIDEEEVEMLDSVFDFGDTIAREIMTPRVDVDSISTEQTVRDAATMIEQTGHSRLPVYRGTDDQILGIVHAKDIMKAILNGQGDRILSHVTLRPAVAVPENKGLHDLLEDMRLNKTQMVIVQDEFGGTAGIVTIEDLVEEVMGEIVDEYDVEEEPVSQDGDAYIVSARLHLDDVNKAIGSELTHDEFDTLGGYVFGLFGRQPKPAENIESEGYRFTIMETSGKRILKVRVELPQGQDENILLSLGTN